MIISHMETATHMEKLPKGWKATGTLDIPMQIIGHKGLRLPKLKKKKNGKKKALAVLTDFALLLILKASFTKA